MRGVAGAGRGEDNRLVACHRRGRGDLRLGSRVVHRQLRVGPIHVTVIVAAFFGVDVQQDPLNARQLDTHRHRRFVRVNGFAFPELL